MAYTLAQYQALQAAIASGATIVKYSDKEVHYRSLGEMKIILSEMKADLGIVRKKSRKILTVYDKGLNDCRRIPRGTPPSVVPTSPSATFSRSVYITIRTTPNPMLLVSVGSGKKIYAEYPTGSTLRLLTHETDPSDEVGWLIGKYVNTLWVVSGNVLQTINLNPATGTITYDFLDGDTITLQVLDTQ